MNFISKFCTVIKVSAKILKIRPMKKFVATKSEVNTPDVLTYCMYPWGTVSRMVVSQLVMCREYIPGTKHLPRSCVLSCLEPDQTSIASYYSSKTFKKEYIFSLQFIISRFVLKFSRVNQLQIYYNNQFWENKTHDSENPGSGFVSIQKINHEWHSNISPVIYPNPNPSYLWGYVVRCSAQSFLSFSVKIHFSCQTEISDLNLQIIIEEHVAEL